MSPSCKFFENSMLQDRGKIVKCVGSKFNVFLSGKARHAVISRNIGVPVEAGKMGTPINLPSQDGARRGHPQFPPRETLGHP